MLTHIQLTNFRIHKSTDINIVDHFSALVGKNDIGKSSVLEALDILCNSGKSISEDDKTQGSTAPANIVVDTDNGISLDYSSTTIEDDRRAANISFYKFGVDDNNHFIDLNQDLNSLIKLWNNNCQNFIELTYRHHFERKKLEELLNIFIYLHQLYSVTTSQTQKDVIDNFMNDDNRDLQKIISKKNILHSNCHNSEELEIVDNLLNILSQFETDIQEVLQCDNLTDTAKKLIIQFEESGDSNLIKQISGTVLVENDINRELVQSLIDKPYYIAWVPDESVDPVTDFVWESFKDKINNTYLNGGSQINSIPFFDESVNTAWGDLLTKGSLTDISSKADEILAQFEQYSNSESQGDIVYLWERYLESFGSRYIKLTKRGSGFKRLCEIYAFTMSILGNIPNSGGSTILAVEEPEISLHPSQQRDIVKRLRDILRLHNTQVIISTHSPYIVNELDEKSVCILNGETQTDANGKPIETVTTKAIGNRIINYPSMAEINYLAFDEPSITYHQELYGQVELEHTGKSDGNSCDLLIKHLWEHSGYNKMKKLIDEYNNNNNFPNVCNSGSFRNRIITPSSSTDHFLPTCIRNSVDHPCDDNRKWKQNVHTIDLSIKILYEINKDCNIAKSEFKKRRSRIPDFDRFENKCKCSIDGVNNAVPHSIAYWVNYCLDNPEQIVCKQDKGKPNMANSLYVIMALNEIDPDWLTPYL